MPEDQTLLKNLDKLTLSEIANRRGNPIDGGVHAYLDAEITRRTAKAQIDAARYMKLSVIILGIAATVGALFQGLAWAWPNPFHLH